LKVIKAFSQARRDRRDIELTISVMSDAARAIQDASNVDGLTVVSETVEHDRILRLYEESDVSIQVSTHEGLGLGFYESISRGVPVISIDAPPHNEAVLNNQTGWLLPSFRIPLPDNDDGLVTAWDFDLSSLRDLLLSLSKEQVCEVLPGLQKIYNSRHTTVRFAERLAFALR
jgi:glycosyltransferase involved in cell wall biosynthesis